MLKKPKMLKIIIIALKAVATGGLIPSSEEGSKHSAQLLTVLEIYSMVQI